MNVQELRKLIENSSDRFGIFADKSILSQYNFNINELLGLISDFLSDTEKAKLFELEHFKKLPPYTKVYIVKLVSDDNIKSGLLEDSDIISGIESYQVVEIAKSLGDYARMKILQKADFFKERGVKSFEISSLLETLSDESKYAVLSNKDYIVQELQLEDFEICKLVSAMQSEEIKETMIDLYKFKSFQIIDIIKTFSDGRKLELLNENKYPFNKDDMIKIFSSMTVDTLVELFREDKEFFARNKISLYRITRNLDDTKQLELVEKFETAQLSLVERRQILATLKKEVKQNIDKSKLPKEYVTAIEMELGEVLSDFGAYGKIIVDFNGDLEKYERIR